MIWVVLVTMVVTLLSFTITSTIAVVCFAEILGDPYSKKSPLPSVGTSPRLAISPTDTSYQLLGQAKIQQRHTTCHNC